MHLCAQESTRVGFYTPVVSGVALHRVVFSRGGVAVWFRSSLRSRCVFPLMVCHDAVARPEAPRRTLDLTELLVVAGAKASSPDGFTEALYWLVVSVLVTFGDQ